MSEDTYTVIIYNDNRSAISSYKIPYSNYPDYFNDICKAHQRHGFNCYIIRDETGRELNM